MNRSQFIAFVRDVHAHPERLAYYRKKYKNVYPFSDGIFKMLMANEAKHERTIKFLNAMLGLYGGNAIKTFTLGVPENPGVLNDKTAIFDIYGITEANSPILIEVQQNYNARFIDRLIYYTARVMSRTVKKSQDYNLPHIYVLSLLTENQFPKETKLLDKDFVKDVSFGSYTDEILLNEVDGMTDMLYEKQGSYMQGQEDLVKTLIDAGKITADEAEHYIKISKEQRQKKK